MQSKGKRSSTLAFLAAAMFLLAGVISAFAAFMRHNTGTSSVAHAAGFAPGAMFLCVGFLWFAIGLKWRKQTMRTGRDELVDSSEHLLRTSGQKGE